MKNLQDKQLIERLLKALQSQRRVGACYCDKSIGHIGDHTLACREAVEAEYAAQYRLKTK